jgi:hypothetical protein
MVSVTPKTVTISNGTANDASVVDGEYVKLFANDATLATAVTAIEANTPAKQGAANTFTAANTFSGTVTLGTVAGTLTVTGGTTFQKNPAGVLTSKITPPYYTSAATITIPAGNMAVTSTGFTITLAADRTISLASSGAGGLASGSEANDTWYYPWLIADSTGANTPHGVFHTSYTSAPTIPSGYDRAAWLSNVAIRNAGADILPFAFTGWPYAPDCVYNVTIARPNGTAGATSVLEVAAGAAATSYTDVNCTSYIPPFATMGRFWLSGTAGATAAVINIRTNGMLNDGHGIVQDIATNRYAGKTVLMATDANQVIEYAASVAAPSVQIAVEGWRI